jgi:hypothetical protein
MVETRKLAATLAAAVVGVSRFGGANEKRTSCSSGLSGAISLIQRSRLHRYPRGQAHQKLPFRHLLRRYAGLPVIEFGP